MVSGKALSVDDWDNPQPDAQDEDNDRGSWGWGGGGEGEARAGGRNGEAKGKTALDEWDAVCTF
jgi:hypothetical protein